MLRIDCGFGSRPEGRKSNVIEEVADVTIMMRQMTLLFGEENVNKVIIAKMKRLEKTLNNYKDVCEEL